VVAVVVAAAAENAEMMNVVAVDVAAERVPSSYC